MTDTAAQLQKEINEMNAKRLAVIEENTAICTAPKSKRSYSYRKTTAIKAHDLAL